MHFEPNTVSLSDYLDYWFDNYCKMNLKYNTQLAYLSIINNHLKPKFGHYRLNALQTAHVQEYANSLKLEGYAKSHVVGIISTLSGAYNYAIEPLKYVQSNQCERVIYPKYTRSTKQDKRYIISSNLFTKITSRFNSDNQFYLPLMIGYYTGLRISETFALTWDDINLEKQSLTVNKITVKRNYGLDTRKVMNEKCNRKEKSTWYFSSPKTMTSNRTILFGDAYVMR